MDKLVPTKANLIKSKSMLTFSLNGFELLDKKRNVLIREMIGLMDRANKIQEEIKIIFAEAFTALQISNVTMGTSRVEDIALSIPYEPSYNILLTSVMGVELPTIVFEHEEVEAYYGFFRTNPSLDNAVENFRRVRFLLYELSEVETSVYKLAIEIKKTQKRANALDKIQIPKYKEIVKNIEEVLEEKEREDFFRLKKVKEKKRR
ncbi:MAG: V-type ATP synthase subunit D [Acidaminobacteraceae bacterium]